jgi:hypothetical protein
MSYVHIYITIAILFDFNIVIIHIYYMHYLYVLLTYIYIYIHISHYPITHRFNPYVSARFTLCQARDIDAATWKNISLAS